ARHGARVWIGSGVSFEAFGGPAHIVAAGTINAKARTKLRRLVVQGAAPLLGGGRGRRRSPPPLGRAIPLCCLFICRISMPASYSIAIRLTQAEERRWKCEYSGAPECSFRYWASAAARSADLWCAALQSTRSALSRGPRLPA